MPEFFNVFYAPIISVLSHLVQGPVNQFIHTRTGCHSDIPDDCARVLGNTHQFVPVLIHPVHISGCSEQTGAASEASAVRFECTQTEAPKSHQATRLVFAPLMCACGATVKSRSKPMGV
jgi:hypothetical protein